MADNSNGLRKAVITWLKADAGVSAIVSNRVHDEVQQNPTWPFIRYGFVIARPYETSCGDGSEHDVTLHAFARGPGTANITALAAAVVASLDDASLTVSGAENYGIDWIDTVTMNDGAEVSDYHAVIRFRAALVN